MPLPPSVTRMNRNGVRFTSNVDQANYKLKELTRAALRDIAKFLVAKMRYKGAQIGGGKLRGKKRLRNAFQYWVRKRETDLLVFTKAMTWYGYQQEMGTMNQPKREIIRGTVLENIQIIRDIQAQYLKHIENEEAALRLIDENDEGENDE